METSHNVFGNSIDVIGILLDGIMSIEVPMILVNVTEKAEDLIIVSANYAYCRMLGYTPKELSGSAAKILAGPDTNLDEWEALGRSIKSNVAPPPGKCYLYKKDGSRILISWVGAPVDRNANGNPRHCFVILRQEVGDCA